MKELTDRQHEILSYIKSTIEANGYSPSYREIGDHFKINEAAVHDHIHALAAKGAITFRRGIPRTITICKGEEK